MQSTDFILKNKYIFTVWDSKKYSTLYSFLTIDMVRNKV